MASRTEVLPLAWPPPGLGRLQGDLWALARIHLIGGLLLVVPLIPALRETDRLGLENGFGESWWVPLATTALALLVLLAAYVGTVRFFRRCRAGSIMGYDLRIIALVAADKDRDGGFLLRGLRYYSGTSKSTLATVRGMRIAAAVLAFLGAIWLSAGSAIGVLLATRGIVPGPGSLGLLALGPSGLLVLAGTFLVVLEGGLVRDLRRKWFAAFPRGDRASSERVEASAWIGAVQGVDPASTPSMRPALGRAFGAGAVASGALAVIVVVPFVAISGVAAFASIVATMGVPSNAALTDRMARYEPLRRYRIAPDPTLTAQEAGEILHVVAGVGTEPRDPAGWFRSPARVYDQPWFDNARDNPTGISAWAWHTALFSDTADTLGPEAIAFLEERVAHPAAVEFRRLGRAASVDMISGRFRSPLPAGWGLIDPPRPNVSGLRSAAFLQVAHAFLLSRDGRFDEARVALGELLSVAFLLMDESTTLMDQIIGSSLAAIGGTALEGLLRREGQIDEADRLAWAMESTTSALGKVSSGRGSAEPASVERLAEGVLDRATPPAFRWEAFVFVNTVGPCLSLRRVLFGPGEAHSDWESSARADLVRYPSEVEFFERAKGGYFGGPAEEGSIGVLPRVLASVLGRGAEPGSCAHLTQFALALARGS